MPRLILLNGPPGVGKSTLARRYLGDHPLALLVEIDELRMAMGGWAEHEESKLQARVLALALVRAHLAAGHDVIVPQYLGRPDFVDELQSMAREVAAIFDHVVLRDGDETVAERFRSRRELLNTEGSEHPQAAVRNEEIDAAIADARRRLDDMTTSRSEVRVVDVAAGDSYDRLMAALE